jgi:hypothetical protein
MQNELANSLWLLVVAKLGETTCLFPVNLLPCLSGAMLMMIQCQTTPTLSVLLLVNKNFSQGLFGLSLTRWSGNLLKLGRLSLWTCSGMHLVLPRIMSGFGQLLNATMVMLDLQKASPWFGPCVAVDVKDNRRSDKASLRPPKPVVPVIVNLPSLGRVCNMRSG